MDDLHTRFQKALEELIRQALDFAELRAGDYGTDGLCAAAQEYRKLQAEVLSGSRPV